MAASMTLDAALKLAAELLARADVGELAALLMRKALLREELHALRNEVNITRLRQALADEAAAKA